MEIIARVMIGWILLEYSWSGAVSYHRVAVGAMGTKLLNQVYGEDSLAKAALKLSEEK